MRGALLLGLLLGAASGAAPAAASVRLAFEQFRLPNGLRVVLAPDPAVPVAAVAMIFKVGGRQENPGRSGFAHLFEHLMFEGSAHVPRGQFDKILEGLGADNNASTHEDFTFYYEVLPSNALPVALWLDADRLSALDVSEEGVRNQISVVKEEKRMRVDNQPYAPMLWVEIASRTFSNWANAHPTIGSFEDLDAAGLGDVRKFFKDHYAPKNAILAVAGDFDPARVRRLVERYFAWVPNAGEAAPPDTAEPEQSGERSFVVPDAHAESPAVALVWKGMPPRRSPEAYALALLGQWLFSGKSARLYQLLVKEKQVATSIEYGGLGFPLVDWWEYREPGLFGGFILQRSEVPAGRIRDLIVEELARVAASGIGEEELKRVKTKFRSDWILDWQSALGRARALLTAAALDGDPAAANGELERYEAVSPEAVRNAAARFLVPERLNVFEAKPSGGRAP